MSSSSISNWRARGLVWLVLLAILACIFAKSFQRHEVIFSNDAPLGILRAQDGKGVNNFLGVWVDANWIGGEQPSAVPNFSNLWFVITQSVGYAKTYAPVSSLILGLGAWLFFRQIGFGWIACLLGALAAALNMNTFSNACWGLPSRALTLACMFFCLAALANYKRGEFWVRSILAGLAIGLGVSEGYDVGAIFSVYLAGFALFLGSFSPARFSGKTLLAAAARVACMALFAALIAAQALFTLITTQVQGVAGLEQTQKSKLERWNEATQWSLPKIETLRVVAPGLFGYRMVNADGALYNGSYWGAVGRDALWPSQGLARHSGSGEYAGILVVLLAIWALVELRLGERSIFSLTDRRVIAFWAVAAMISLLLAYGRYAPFYQIVYAIPYASLVRNPIKFMHPFHLCLLVLFGYGVESLARRYLAGSEPALGLKAQLAKWRGAWRPFEAKWAMATGAAFAAAVVAWLAYAGAQPRLKSAIAAGGFSADQASAIASFSIGEVGWSVLFLGLSLGAVWAVMSGWLAGRRAGWAAVAFGIILVADLSRADRHWIVYYDYTQTYASNPVIDFLRRNAYEHRAAARIYPLSAAFLATGQAAQIFPAIYDDWLQNQFQYYRVQSLDIVQMPRMPVLDHDFLQRFSPVRPDKTEDLPAVGRLWELTNTRFILGQSGFLDLLNSQVDPGRGRFRIRMPFNIVPKPSYNPQAPRLEDLTVAPQTNGVFAVFEFEGALPRAKLYPRWEVVTDDHETLDKLASPSFDPWRTVLVSNPVALTAAPSGSNEAARAQIVSYSPKRLRVKTDARAPAILMIDGKYDPNWKVWIDGQPANLLRCNYLMKGAALPAGAHQVEFRFEPSPATLFVSLGAIALGLILLIYLRARPNSEQPEPPRGAAMR